MAKKPDELNDPPTPDRQGVDAGTWLWIATAVLAILAILAWASFADLPRGPR